MDLKMEKEKVKKIILEGIKKGGFTVDYKGNTPNAKKGYIVSDYGKEKTYFINDKIDMIQLEKDFITYIDYAEKEKDVFIGGWLDGDVFFLDISRIYPNKKEALKIGKKNKQLAIYDIEKDASIELVKEFYSIHNIKKDFLNIMEFNNIKDLEAYFNIKNAYQYIVKDIDNIKDNQPLLNDKYIICKNEIQKKEKDG